MRHPHLFARSAPSAAFTGLVALLLSAGWSGRASADWPNSSSTNLAVCTASNTQGTVDLVTDGRGGAIFVWSDSRTGLSTDVYAQHVQASGVLDPAWTTNGNAVCTASGNQASPKAVADGAGGALVFWVDYRRSGFGADAYAIRLLGNGQLDPAWPVNGLPVCTADSTQAQLASCSDGTGGAYIAWWDWRNGLDRDVYLHHVLPSGSVDPAWPANGLAVCVAAGDQLAPRVVPDGSGGAIVTWGDARSDASDVYAERVLASGLVDPGWPLSGVAVCALAGAQQVPDLAGDGDGGAFVVWQDSRSGTSADIYSQHLLATGAIDPAWPADGRPLCAAAGEQANPKVIATAHGRAIACWMDRRGASMDVYAASVDGPGGSWPLDGRALCSATADQEYPSTVPDGTGGALVCWRDKRTDLGDIYATHVLASGDLDANWPVNGSALSTAPAGQQIPLALADGSGGAIVTWQDYRSSVAYPDIYAQRVQANGQLGGTVVDVPLAAGLGFSLDPVRPNPLRGGPLTVRFSLAHEANATLELMDLAGRRLVSRELGALGPGSHTADLAPGVRIPAGLYFVRLRSGDGARSVRVAILD